MRYNFYKGFGLLGGIFMSLFSRNFPGKLGLVLIASVLLIANSVSAKSNEPISVFIDGKVYTFQQPPIMEKGRVLVPMRGIFEALGAKVTWDQKTGRVEGVKGDKRIVVKVGEPAAYVGDSAVYLL